MMQQHVPRAKLGSCERDEHVGFDSVSLRIALVHLVPCKEWRQGKGTKKENY